MISEYLIKKAAENTTVPQQQNNDNEMDPTGETYQGGWQLPYDPHRPANPSRPKYPLKPWITQPYGQPSNKPQRPYGQPWWQPHGQPWEPQPKWQGPWGPFGPFMDPKLPPNADPINPRFNPWGPYRQPEEPQPSWPNPWGPFIPRRRPSSPPWVNPGYPVNPRFNPWGSSDPDNSPWWRPILRTLTTPEASPSWHGGDPYTVM